MKLKVLQEIPGIQVHYADDQRFVSSKKMAVLGNDGSGAGWQQQFVLPSYPLTSLSLNSSLYCRLTRGGIHSILPISDKDNPDWIVVAQGKIFLVSATGSQISELYQIKRGHRPLRRGICVTKDRLFWGEYWRNPNREPINIYSVEINTQKVETIYQFGRKTIRHIHAVEKDPYNEKLWISTGDEDSECMIALLDQFTGELEIIGQGEQKWRTVSFCFCPEGVYWGSDNHLGKNKIWRFDRATKHVQVVGDVIGPVYYNTCLNKYIVFGTTMEKGEGQQDGYGRLYAIDFYGRIVEIWKQRKDLWHPRLFGYGVFEFAEGRISHNRFWITAKGFEGGLRSFLFELEEN